MNKLNMNRDLVWCHPFFAIFSDLSIIHASTARSDPGLSIRGSGAHTGYFSKTPRLGITPTEAIFHLANDESPAMKDGSGHHDSIHCLEVHLPKLSGIMPNVEMGGHDLFAFLV